MDAFFFFPIVNLHSIMHRFVATVALFVGVVHARKSAKGPCTALTDQEECCGAYDNRLQFDSASHCVWSETGFKSGKCEAEAAVVASGECAAVGSCREHVPVASSACLALVVDKIRVRQLHCASLLLRIAFIAPFFLFLPLLSISLSTPYKLQPFSHPLTYPPPSPPHAIEPAGDR